MKLSDLVAAFNRRRKWATFAREIGICPESRVLDIGFSDEDYSPQENFIEKHYPYPQMLTALGLEEPTRIRKRHPQVKFVRYGGGAFPFADQRFDVCWANAVIEHVGPRDEQLLFLKEVRRVARRAFLSTPNRYFPIEVHTLTPLLHYLPKAVFDRYLHLIGKGWAAGGYMYLLSRGELAALLRDAGVARFRILSNRLGGLTLDFVVIIDS